MAEESSSSSLLSEATDLLATPSHERLELLLNQLDMHEDTLEFQSALTLFNFCAQKFPNRLTLMLLKVYESSSKETTRFQSIHLLSSTLQVHGSTHVSLEDLNDIKALLISCLKMQETEETQMKILRTIVSFVACDVVSLDNDGWDELSACILSFAETEPLKAFHVFIELPRFSQSFIDRFMQRILEEAQKVLLVSQEEDNVEVWSLGLQTLLKMGVQILDSVTRSGLVNILAKSVKALVNKEEFVVEGLDNLEKFLLKDRDMYGYSKDQCLFVSVFMDQIRELGPKIMEVTTRINRFIRANINEADIVNLNTLSLLQIVASDDQEESFKDMAIRRLDFLLSDDNPKEGETHVPLMRKLQTLLLSCLTKEGISESMFQILGKVVYHVAVEMMYSQGELWLGLRDYIVSNSRTAFQRALYIFQCLRMPLDKEGFVITVMENLGPEISSRLCPPPSEVLVENTGWVLAFTGAFCAIIHLIDVGDHQESVDEIGSKMIDSARQLVQRGMEVGLVRRAFTDLESIVMKDMEWFTSSKYNFIKGFLGRLYAIEGMKMESKVMLWRINFRLERGVTEESKELPDPEAATMAKATDLLATPSHETLELLLNQHAMPEETLGEPSNDPQQGLEMVGLTRGQDVSNDQMVGLTRGQKKNLKKKKAKEASRSLPVLPVPEPTLPVLPVPEPEPTPQPTFDDEIPINMLCEHGINENVLKVLQDIQIKTVNQLEDQLKETRCNISGVSNKNIILINKAITKIKDNTRRKAELFVTKFANKCDETLATQTKQMNQDELAKFVHTSYRALQCVEKYETLKDILLEINEGGCGETLRQIDSLIMEIDCDLVQAYSFHARLRKDVKERPARIERAKLERERAKVERANLEKTKLDKAGSSNHGQKKPTEYILSAHNEVLLESCLETHLVDKLKLHIPTMNLLFKKSKKELYELGNLSQEEIGIIWNAKEDLLRTLKGDSKALKDGWLQKVASCVEQNTDWPLCIRRLYLIPDEISFVSPALFQEYIQMAEPKTLLAYQADCVLVSEQKEEEQEKSDKEEQKIRRHEAVKLKKAQESVVELQNGQEEAHAKFEEKLGKAEGEFKEQSLKAHAKFEEKLGKAQGEFREKLEKVEREFREKSEKSEREASLKIQQLEEDLKKAQTKLANLEVEGTTKNEGKKHEVLLPRIDRIFQPFSLFGNDHGFVPSLGSAVVGPRSSSVGSRLSSSGLADSAGLSSSSNKPSPNDKVC